MEYRTLGEPVVLGGHLQRGNDQVGLHVLGHGVADAGLGVTVDDGGHYVESRVLSSSSVVALLLSGVDLTVVLGLVLDGWDVLQAAVEPVVVEPVHPTCTMGSIVTVGGT